MKNRVTSDEKRIKMHIKARGNNKCQRRLSAARTRIRTYERLIDARRCRRAF